MPTSETDSDQEPELVTNSVSNLTAFARLSATRPSQPNHRSVGWAVDTLAKLDFRLVREDTTLHGLVQNCASTILISFDQVLQHTQTSASEAYDFISDIAIILRRSFLRLLFQYRRLFRIIATRNFKLDSAPLAIVCWVDVILAKLGDVAAFIAAGLDGDNPDQSLSESFKVQREEDNLRAAIQLPDNWDMLPPMLLSQRVSTAAKRLCVRLMLGTYILCPALSGQVCVDNTIHQLHSTFAEFVRQSAARVDQLCPVLGPGLLYLAHQERLTSAMTISLFAAAEIAQTLNSHSTRLAAFRPQTMTAAMQLLRFVLNEGGYITRTSVLNPSDHLDIPVSVIIRWGIVPQWTWSIWLEHRSLHADIIMYLTTTCIQHHSAAPGTMSELSDLMSFNDNASNQAAAISVMIDLLFRFIPVLSSGHSKQLSTSMTNVLYGSCRLISQWINRNSCGIQRSTECCKVLIILFGYLSQDERHAVLIECLALMKGQCSHDAWNAASEDNEICFLKALDQSFTRTKAALSRDDLSKCQEICAVQLMQFLVVMMSKGVQPLGPDAFVDFIDAVGERVLETPPNDRGLLFETFLTCLATANLSEIELPFNKTGIVADDETIWGLWMCGGDMNLFLASSFSLYIASGLAGVEPLAYQEGLERLVDIALVTCSRQHASEHEPLALIVLPTICDALARLLDHTGDRTVCAWANTRISALRCALQSLASGDDGYGELLRRRLSSVDMMGGARTADKREYELVFCRLDGVRSRLLYVLAV